MADQLTSHYLNQWWWDYWQMYASFGLNELTHWGRVAHICVGNLTIIGSDNGLSPGRRQAITWTNVRILLIGPSGTNFSEVLIEIQAFSFKKMHLKMSSAKWRPFCLGLNELNNNVEESSLLFSHDGGTLCKISNTTAQRRKILTILTNEIQREFSLNFTLDKTESKEFVYQGLFTAFCRKRTEYLPLSYYKFFRAELNIW